MSHQFNPTKAEFKAVCSEVHNENTKIVKFLLSYMRRNSKIFDSDIRGGFNEMIQIERDILNALCIHLGAPTTKCREKFIVVMRYTKAMNVIKAKRYYK